MVGTRLGPFEIRDRVDLPGFGEVYAAYDHENNRDVAIHVLRTNAAQDEGVRDRFERDVRAAAARIQPDPLTIHLIGVDPQAIYVVSDRLRLAAEPFTPAVPPRAAGATGHDVRAPRRRWVAAAVVALAVIAAIVAIGRDEAPPVERALRATASPPPAVQTPAPPAAAPAGELPPLESTEVRNDVVTETPPPAPARTSPEPAPDPAPEPRVMTPAPSPPVAAAPPPAATVEDSRDTTTLITEATVHATEFDLAGALAILDVAARRGDEYAHVAALYLRGLIAARDAFRDGGDPETRAPVRESLMALSEIAGGRPGVAEIARLVLHAAAAAAQSERDEMRLYIESAIQMESLQRVAGQSGAPVVSAAELAGDFWLQVHRYDDARRAYADAAERVGFTLRILSGLARTARRLNDMPAACASYRRLVDVWGSRPGLPVEIAEARAYLGGCSP